MQERRHIGVERGKHLLPALHEGDLYALPHEVFRDFQSDKAAAHHDCPSGSMRAHEVMDGERILHRAQRKDASVPDAGGRRNNRIRARRKQELVVAFQIRLTR